MVTLVTLIFLWSLFDTVLAVPYFLSHKDVVPCVISTIPSLNDCYELLRLVSSIHQFTALGTELVEVRMRRPGEVVVLAGVSFLISLDNLHTETTPTVTDRELEAPDTPKSVVLILTGSRLFHLDSMDE
jgi:hypothetical protein